MNMKKITALLAAGMFLATSGIALATETATQAVTYEVQAINELSVSGNPGALTISTATAGDEPNAVSDSGTTYDITTNGTDKKITGAIDTAMPDNVTLTANLTTPTGGTSVGAVTLTAEAQDLVTGITEKAETKGISFELSALVTAGVVPSATKTLTLTIADSGI
jgi:hypothetical protein